MPGFAQPGQLFLGTLSAAERTVMHRLLAGAHAAGYRRLVEPAAGGFSLSHLGRQAGFGAENIEASDVTLFSALLGGYLAGDDPASLWLGIDAARLPLGREELDRWIEQKRYAELLWLLLYCRTKASSRNAYLAEILVDLDVQRTVYWRQIERKLERAKAALGGMRYLSCDLFVHVEMTLSDPSAVVALNPPIYRAGYEKWFDVDGLLTWDAPSYATYDPETGSEQLFEMAKDAPALVLLYLERPAWTLGRYALSCSVNARSGSVLTHGYVVANRPDEAREWLERPVVTRPLVEAL
jgi:hypothetical protein